MKGKRFTEEQIIRVLKEAENGLKVSDLCRQQGISEATYYRWKSKYGGLEVSEAKRLRALEEENRREAFFPHLSELVGHDWLKTGCANLHHAIQQKMGTGSIQSLLEPEENAHPLIRLWYKDVLEKELPSDWIGRDDLTFSLLRLLRLLILEQMIKELKPTWTTAVETDVLHKLRAADQFGSTLFELRVAYCLRKSGYDVNIQVPKGIERADIASQWSDKSVRIECKRIGLKAPRNMERVNRLGDLGTAIAASLGRWGRCVLLELNIDGDADFEEIRQAVTNLEEIPADYHGTLGQDWWIRMTTYDGEEQIRADLDGYEQFVLDGAFQIGRGPLELRVVAIRDNVPSNWLQNVRSALNVARKQLPRKGCNWIFLEVADMPFFVDDAELEHVFDGVKQFLERDTSRIAGVVVSISGAAYLSENRSIENGPVAVRSAGRTWLFPGQGDKLIHDFQFAKFDQPLIEVQMRLQETQLSERRRITEYRVLS